MGSLSRSTSVTNQLVSPAVTLALLQSVLQTTARLCKKNWSDCYISLLQNLTMTYHIQKNPTSYQDAKDPPRSGPCSRPPLICLSCPCSVRVATLVVLLFLELAMLISTFPFSLPGTLFCHMAKLSLLVSCSNITFPLKLFPKQLGRFCTQPYLK